MCIRVPHEKCAKKKVLQKGLEGLVLKNVNGLYEPGKRHWLKVKKDYLFDGKMADSADLVVLGAWFGTGKKGGMLSIFLMGCFDEKRNVWKTVTKVHTGLDDAAMEAIQVKFILLLFYSFYSLLACQFLLFVTNLHLTIKIVFMHSLHYFHTSKSK